MKSILIFIWCTISLISLGQNTFPSSGDVGIGTSSPGAKLDIMGNSSSYTGSDLSLSRSSTLPTIGQGVGIQLNDNGALGYNFIQHSTVGLQFFNLYNGSGWTERMRIAANGNIGIGTSNPSQKLSVIGGSIKIGDEVTPQYIGRASDLVSGGVANDMALRSDNGNILFSGSSSERMRITNAGLVGIGIVNPQAKLHIQSNANGGLAISGNNSSYVGADLFLSRTSTLSNVGTGVTIQLTDIGSNSHNIIQSSPSGLQFVNFYNDSGWIERMRISSNGNVGIGTDSPDTKLSVKGTIHSQEVKVDMLGAMVPDYVFEKDYNLSSLDSIKTFIDKNKHLPDVPSAKEMEANGVNLGEMNMMLLKKMEEMTLYMIKTSTQVEILKIEINSLKKNQ